MAKLNLKDIHTPVNEWDDYLMPVIFEEDYEFNTPQKLLMRLDLKKNNKVKVKKDSWCTNHSNTRIHQFYSYMNNWIPTTLGQSVDDVYAKFCKK